MCAECGSFLRTNTNSPAQSIKTTPAPTNYWANTAILTFPLWGTYLILSVLYSPDNGNIGYFCVGLSIFSALPIVLAESISAGAKILLLFGYYMISAVVMLFVVLAVAGQA